MTIEAPEFQPLPLLGLLSKARISPDRIILEITERQGIEHLDTLRTKLNACRAAGFRIAIDDLGAGNSGLRLLSEIQFDIVKIDLSLVQAGTQREASLDIVRSLMELSTRWGAYAVAEGVETVEQLHMLRAIGLGHAQGYLLGRPMTEPRLAPDRSRDDPGRARQRRDPPRVRGLVDLDRLPDMPAARAEHRRQANLHGVQCLGALSGGEGSGSLILRIVRGRILPGRHDLVRAGLVASFSQVRELAGVVQAHMALRSVAEGNDFAVISTWTTPDAAMAVFGRNVDRVASIPGVSEHLDFRSVEHFEIDESLLLHADEPPTVARIAVGSVQLGNDVEIQQEIRTRMGALGGEVAEAYVGRRIRDRTVEVAFVTLWAGRPADRPLDEPLWHDVAERYDSYWIEVYDEIYPA